MKLIYSVYVWLLRKMAVHLIVPLVSRADNVGLDFLLYSWIHSQQDFNAVKLAYNGNREKNGFLANTL